MFEKPQVDNREYQHLILKNGLRCLLVSDEETEKVSLFSWTFFFSTIFSIFLFLRQSACSMDIGVGAKSDPKNVQGLAHFCEHMLFLGTEKFPEENQYSQFLAEHSGSSNAYTAYENTNYYFEILADHLEGIIDIFSQFFISPLFTESATERELNAIQVGLI